MGTIRPPIPALRAYVYSVWAGHARSIPEYVREHVLPCGQMHLAVRLGGAALRLYADAKDGKGETIGDAVVAGARADYYIKDVSMPARSVGVQLRPGAAQALFGVPAWTLQGRHTTLDALWGAEAERLRNGLNALDNDEARFDLLQSTLVSRLRVRTLHPAIAEALARIEAGGNIAELAEGAGMSHRHFILLFSDAVGLSPKRYARVLRFRKLLRALAVTPARSWIELALDAGYSDQSHCIREFRVFTGVTPRVYRRDAGARPHHLPLLAAD